MVWDESRQEGRVAPSLSARARQLTPKATERAMDEGIRRPAAHRDRTWAERAAKRPDRLSLWAGGLAGGALLAAGPTAHAGSGGVSTTGGSGGGGKPPTSASTSRYVRIWSGF